MEADGAAVIDESLGVMKVKAAADTAAKSNGVMKVEPDDTAAQSNRAMKLEGGGS